MFKRNLLIVFLVMVPCLNKAFNTDYFDEDSAKKSKMVNRLWLNEQKQKFGSSYANVQEDQIATFKQLHGLFKTMMSNLGSAVGTIEVVNFLDMYLTFMNGDEIDLPREEFMPYYERFLEIMSGSMLSTQSKIIVCKLLKQIFLDNKF